MQQEFLLFWTVLEALVLKRDMDISAVIFLTVSWSTLFTFAHLEIEFSELLEDN